MHVLLLIFTTLIGGIWVVYFINEGIGPTLHLDGLHFVTIQPTNRTFNIYNFYNEEHLLAWNHCDIRRVGRVGTLVFLEVGRRCQGGPGVLWMYCADHLAAEFRESLDKLASCSFACICSYLYIRIYILQNVYKTIANLLQLNRIYGWLSWLLFFM